MTLLTVYWQVHSACSFWLKSIGTHLHANDCATISGATLEDAGSVFKAGSLPKTMVRKERLSQSGH